MLAYVNRVRDVEASGVDHATMTLADIEANPVRCPDPASADAMYKGATAGGGWGAAGARADGRRAGTCRCKPVCSLPSINQNSKHPCRAHPSTTRPPPLPPAIDSVRTRGESCGGEVTCVVRGCPKGLGAPVFDKLEAELAKAIMSLPATKVGRRWWGCQRGWCLGAVCCACSAAHWRPRL